jgi:hypothetical protein
VKDVSFGGHKEFTPVCVIIGVVNLLSLLIRLKRNVKVNVLKLWR